jgi:hypothetical protein
MCIIREGLNVRTMVLSFFTKQRILSSAWKGYKISAVVECLVLEEGIWVSKQGVRQFLQSTKLLPESQDLDYHLNFHPEPVFAESAIFKHKSKVTHKFNLTIHQGDNGG